MDAGRRGRTLPGIATCGGNLLNQITLVNDGDGFVVADQSRGHPDASAVLSIENQWIGQRLGDKRCAAIIISNMVARRNRRCREKKQALSREETG